MAQPRAATGNGQGPGSSGDNAEEMDMSLGTAPAPYSAPVRTSIDPLESTAKQHAMEPSHCQILNELSEGLLTAKECVEAAHEGPRMLECLTLTLASKFMDEQDKIEEAIKVLERHCYPVKHLKMMSELFQQRLVTVDELPDMKARSGILPVRLVLSQYIKSSEKVTTTADVLLKFGYKKEANKLKVLSELFQKDLMTAKELKWLGETADLTGCLVQFLYTKSQDVVDRAANLLCKLGYEEEERQLRVLSCLFIANLVSESDMKKMKEYGDLPANHVRAHYTHPQRKTVRSKDEWNLMKGLGYLHGLVNVRCTESSEVVARVAEVLDMFDCRKEASKLKVLNELFHEGHLTEEQCLQIARTGHTWNENLGRFLSDKPVKVVQKASQVLEKHGCIGKDLKPLEVLQGACKQFLADMETEAVVPKLVEEGIILRSVQKAIDDASSREEKNKLLYDDLLKYCTEDTLMTVCKVAIGTVDMKKMVELGQSLANELKRGVEVLESNEQTFFQYMDSQAMSQALLSNEVIPEHIQAKMATVGRQEANEVLFDYLMFHCTKSSLLVVGKVTREMSEEMAKLGKDILLQLDQDTSVGRQESEEAPPKRTVARVELYKHDRPELTGRQIRAKLMEDKVCSEEPPLSAIYDILRRLPVKDSLYACLKANRRVLLNDYPNVTSLHMLNKSVKDKETGQLCLVIGVRKKKERNSLEDPQILPEKIQHGWYRHFVDVFEEELQLLGPQPSDRAPPPMACFNS